MHVAAHFPAETTNHFRYPRHFLVLTCFCALIAVMSRVNLTGSLSVAFATYGALHASALTLGVRARQSPWRLCLFIAAAAALSVAAVRGVLLAQPMMNAAPGNVAGYSLLGMCAAMGAIAYGILIRWCGLCVLSLGALAVIAVGCMSAALVALFTASHSLRLGPWWIAAWWWYGFSGGLWYFDRGHAADSSKIGR